METSDLLSGPAGDAGVRRAVVADAGGLGAIHERSWRAAYADLLPEPVLAAMPANQLAQAWREAITSPPSAGHEVWVAHHGPTVVGFLAAAPDGEVVALHVDPSHQRRGHASRLLAAAVEHLTTTGVPVVHTWCVMDDLPRRNFFTSAGLGADGTWRRFEVPGAHQPLQEAHLVAALDPSPTEAAQDANPGTETT